MKLFDRAKLPTDQIPLWSQLLEQKTTTDKNLLRINEKNVKHHSNPRLPRWGVLPTKHRCWVQNWKRKIRHGRESRYHSNQWRLTKVPCLQESWWSVHKVHSVNCRLQLETREQHPCWSLGKEPTWVYQLSETLHYPGGTYCGISTWGIARMLEGHWCFVDHSWSSTAL